MNMLNECDYWQQQIWLWLEEELDPGEVKALEAHLKTCPVCRQELERQRRLGRLLASAPMAMPEPGFAQRFQERVRSRTSRGRTWAGMSILAVAGIGLSALLALSLVAASTSFWQQLPLEGLLSLVLDASFALLETVKAILQIVSVVLSAVFRSLGHPVFVMYAMATALAVLLWIQFVGRRVWAVTPVTINH